MTTNARSPLLAAAVLGLSAAGSSLAVHAAQAQGGATAPSADATAAAASITSDDLMAHIKTLASDEFEGRAPGTKGEERTVAYLTERFKKLGLKPGNPDGSYVQKVPLAGFTPRARMTFSVAGRPMEVPDADFLARSLRYVPEVSVKDSEMVFVGYGVHAPEYWWDDFKGVDLKGKTLVFLINDPPIPDPKDPNKLDEKMFKGRAMTYYGRWTYKFEIAAEKGAAAAVIVHETGPAGYPMEALASWRQENFDLKAADKNMGKLQVESWISEPRARELFKAAGQDFDALKRGALLTSFKPLPLGARASIEIKTALREVDSLNVVARLEGSDPKLKDEHVVYTAHWDGMGRDPKLQGDQIFNGALDNASGTAALLEIAEAFTRLKPAPRRSLLFLAVTAEEKGLLGAKHYATNPLHPLEKTLANINMDGMNQWGRTRDVVVVGLGNSTLDDIVRDIARTRDRVVKPDAEPEKGFFYRSDHFEFAKQGVPALDTDAGTDFIGKPAGYGMKKREEYTTRDYHKVSDEVKPDWDLQGAAEDARLLFEVGLRVAQGDKWPEWKPGTEFKAKRDRMLKRP
jgi:Zn-dependent M28 family amino/carboxypeptidase